MKNYGVREICNITFKAKADNTKIGTRVFMKDEPVIYFDTAKTSEVSGESEAVYAKGGRGNPDLVTWEGEKKTTFTFEDALISHTGLAILTGADLIATDSYIHAVMLKVRAEDNSGKVELDLTRELEEQYGESTKVIDAKKVGATAEEKEAKLFVDQLDEHGGPVSSVKNLTLAENVLTSDELVAGTYYQISAYIKVKGTTMQITPDKFSDYFYVEAETLFRRESDGVDVAAQFVIPKAKVRTNFTFSMANSGDPSTFTFEMDAMADYTKFNKTKKVLFELSMID